MDDVGSLLVTTKNFDKLDGDEQEPITRQDETFRLIQNSEELSKNLLAIAYIQPFYDNGGFSTNPRPKAEFQLNTPTNDTTQLIEQIRKGRDTETLGTDDYWIAYFQLAYQHVEASDGDTFNVNSTLGGITQGNNCLVCFTNDPSIVPKGGIGSFVFLESIRTVGIDNGLDAREVTAPHELGHHLGLEGHTPDFGIMASGSQSPNKNFVPTHVVILPSRIKSPGR